MDWLKVGDRVSLYKDTSYEGTVTHIDDNMDSVTTCNVLWDGCEKSDIQWTNKLFILEKTDEYSHTTNKILK